MVYLSPDVLATNLENVLLDALIVLVSLWLGQRGKETDKGGERAVEIA